MGFKGVENFWIEGGVGEGGLASRMQNVALK